MKPEPYIPPLTDDETLLLRMQVVRLKGAPQFRMARKLAGLGLGTVDGRTFSATVRVKA